LDTTKIAFLVYHPRSGSTMLSNLLHEYNEIYVSYELDFVDGIVKGKDFSNLQWDNLKENPKSKTWDLPWEKLTKLKFKNFNTFLIEIAKGYKESGVFVYKNGKYRFYLKKLIATFPDSKIIFLSRDPRSVYLSQSITKSSITNKPMIIADPILFSKQFLLTESLVEKVSSEENVLKIRYEDLVNKKDLTINKILSFLNVSSDKSNKLYSKGISEKQKRLHTNVGKVLLKSRLYPWKDTDKVEEMLVIERICRGFLEKENYELSRNRSIALSNFYFKFLLNGAIFKWLWYKAKSRFSINKDHLRF
jgi:hypothetical protein